MATVVVYIKHSQSMEYEREYLGRDFAKKYISRKLEESLKQEKGQGCDIPRLDPFSIEVTQFDEPVEKLNCANNGIDWVKCYNSTCQVQDKRLIDMGVHCLYQDVIYHNDYLNSYAEPVLLKGSEVYNLNASDHVKISCARRDSVYYRKVHETGFIHNLPPSEAEIFSNLNGINTEVPFFQINRIVKNLMNELMYVKLCAALLLYLLFCAKNKDAGRSHNGEMNKLDPSWTGIGAGFRSNVPLTKSRPDRKDGISIIIVGFDSVSKNMFIRKVPKSYNYLTRDLNAIILNGYNIVGDGSIEALFPLLSGKTILELPEATSFIHNSEHLKVEYFIFHLVKQYGYRTLYFEDSPKVNTFLYLVKGFLTRPADHYLRPFCVENSAIDDRDYCVGDTPQYKMMLNLTHQFLRLDGKKFGLNFMVDISHSDFNLISVVDDDLLHFLRVFKEEGHTKDNLLILMSDHGPRFLEMRGTYQGRLEERLPLMAIILPEQLKKKRPEVQSILKANADVLTTPFDLYATMLDAMDLTQHWNKYTVKGADIPRSVSIFRPIPRNRTCSEAGIESHFCSCFKWDIVSNSNPIYPRVANALVHHINKLTSEFRYLCAVRSLSSIEWVYKHIVNKGLLSMQTSQRHFPDFYNPPEVNWELYQVRIEVAPAKGLYEGTVKYLKNLDTFVVNSKEISRTNAYAHEPDCIKDEYPDLKKYCYCYQ